MITIPSSTASPKPVQKAACPKAFLSSRGFFGLLPAALVCVFQTASADQFGDFTYTDNGTSISITGYSTSAVGAVTIPGTIASKPVTSLGVNAFAFCTGITSVTIPSGVTSVGAQAFYNCTGLTSVTVPAGVTSIGTYAFYNCTKLASIPLQAGLLSIGQNAFYLCTSLASVTLPSTVTTLGPGAFYSCTSLTHVTIPSGVTSIPGALFYSCSGLTSVTIPSTVTNIGAQAFQYCSSLTNIAIPSGVTFIGNKAFFFCSGLSSVVLPSAMTTIGTEVFANCIGLTSISVSAVNPNFSSLGGVLFNKLQTTLVAYPPGVAGGYLVPSTVSAIGTKACFTCSKLTGVTFPSGLLSIGQQAFSTCGSLLYANFTGAAPAISFGAFEFAAPGFSIYYLTGATDFTSPTWSVFDIPAAEMGQNSTPATAWLLSKGLPANLDLNSDPNHDGVNLLTAYALNLDPNVNTGTALPKPVVNSNQLTLSFFGGAPGVSYSVEATSDLTHWSTNGVTISAPDANQVRTASVSQDGAGRFMRLVLNY